MQAQSSESTSQARSSVIVGKVAEIHELEPIKVEFNGASIGIYKFNGKFYAYRNVCPHEGGPAVEGAVTFREVQDTKKANIACPWHGIEFDLESGICNATSNLRLSRCNVLIKGDDLVVESI